MHKGARPDLCGGRGATRVPTATEQNIDGTFKQTGWRFRQGNFCHGVICAADDVGGRMRVLPRAITRCTPTVRLLIVLICHPAIAVLSTGHRPVGSCSRAAGWSAATSCNGPKQRSEDVCYCGAVRG